MSTKILFTTIMVLAICVVASEAFLFSFGGSKLDKTKPKSACNPNPCEKDGNCTLDRAQNAVCTCKEGYYGSKCENKNACARKPCKKGSCLVDKVDPKKYTCKCQTGYVGDRCHKRDKCANNGRCQNGKCVLNKKLKPICNCQNGWMGSKCHKRNCTIVRFKGKHFERSPKIYVNKEFAKKLEQVDKIAAKCEVRIKVSKSFTLEVDNGRRSALSTFDQKEAFYAGCAAEIEILDKKGGLLCNSICMSKLPIPSKEAKCFMDALHEIKVKSSIRSSVIHLGCQYSPTFQEEKTQHQVGCKENRF